MFMIMKKRKLNRMDAFRMCVKACVRFRSVKPMMWLVQEGRYGVNHQLEGNFYNYIKYCERTGREVAVVMNK